MIRDCLKVEPVVKEVVKGKGERLRVNKENIRSNNNRETNRNCHKRNKSNSGLEKGRQSEKSIYESVLEDRQQRKARKRIV